MIFQEGVGFSGSSGYLDTCGGSVKINSEDNSLATLELLLLVGVRGGSLTVAQGGGSLVLRR